MGSVLGGRLTTLETPTLILRRAIPSGCAPCPCLMVTMPVACFLHYVSVRWIIEVCRLMHVGRNFSCRMLPTQKSMEGICAPSSKAHPNSGDSETRGDNAK